MMEPDVISTNLRILIIDDNPEIHKDFIKILTVNTPKKFDFQEFEKKLFGETAKPNDLALLPRFIIDTASQGKEGVDMIAKALSEKQPYALAFVDVRMPPGWDGVETIKHIWELDPEIQIVICTAYSDYSWEETVEQLGKKDNLLILKKPFDHVAVRQLSVALTKKWQLHQESNEHMRTLEQHVQQRTKLLQESLSVTRGTLESTIDGILVINNEDQLIDLNNKAIEIWDIPGSILAQKSGVDLLTYITSQLVNHEEFDAIMHELSIQPDAVKTNVLKNANGRIIEHFSQPYRLNDKIAGRIWSFRDITTRSILEDKIKFQAMHDALTGLPNRAHLIEHVQDEIILSENTNSKFALLFLDIDRFKLINDSFSHLAGDELLKEVASRIKKFLRDVDFVSRLGGDEFVIVISHLKSDDDLKKIATKLIYTFNLPFKVTGHDIIVSPSIGVSIYPNQGQKVDELMQHADMAMYRAKELGGNQLQYYIPEMNKIKLDRLQLEADLHKAIKNNEFFLCYQPQYDIVKNKIVSVEALIRWQHPEKGLILPINFIPFAEEVGLMNVIGNWVLTTACIQNKKWQDNGLPPIRVAVNISTQQFKQPDFAETIKNIISQTHINPEYLEIELTENIIISSFEAPEKINKLREMGVRIALDDFGTGYSSLNYLRTLTVDRLKIDKSFIKNIAIKRDDEVIIQAIITMAKSLNLEILAEGVETQQQLDFLKSTKCGEIQGYLFSEPLAPNEIVDFLKHPEKISSGLPSS